LGTREPSEHAFGGGLQIAAVCVLIVAYTALSHYCNTRGAHKLGAALALTPPLAVVLLLLRRASRPVLGVLTAVPAAVLLYDQWPLLEKNFSMVYLLQECGMYGLLAFGFARSLRPGHTALCTQFADKLHGPLTRREVLYTRQVTAAWALLFAAITAANVALYVSAPLCLWSAFVNFATLPLAAAMFGGEYAVRRRVLPQTNRSSILATVRVFLMSR
jgi:uncharacterized membrane protein